MHPSMWPLLALLIGARAQSEAQDPPDGPALDPLMIDRAVAVVGIRVITRSELEVARWLENREPSPVAAVRFDPDRPTEWWIEQVMLRELAGDISVYQPDPAAVRERAERLLAELDPEDLATRGLALGVNRESIVAWVQGRMVVERFVARNLGLGTELLPEAERGLAPSYSEWLDELRDQVAIRRIPIEDPLDLQR